MSDNHQYIIAQIVKYSQKLDQKGFGANHDGNISAKAGDVLLATPTAVSKGNVCADIVLTLDMDGNKISGNGKPFSEIKLHLAAYRTRADVNAVVHAHPPFATARGLVGQALLPALPEAIVSIGSVIPVIEFAMPGAPENEDIISAALEQYDVFMLPGNGVFAVGDNVEQAYLRLELVEHLAKIYYYADNMGAPMQLSAEDISKLLEKRSAIGLGPQGFNATVNKTPNEPLLSSIKNLIAEEIKKAL